MESPQIFESIRLFIESQGEFSPETQQALSLVLYGYFKKIAVELQAKNAEGGKIELSDISSILQNLHFKGEFINELEDNMLEYLANEKRRKISRLRDAGYGATSENVQFIKQVLESPHQTLDPSNHVGEFEMDDE